MKRLVLAAAMAAAVTATIALSGCGSSGGSSSSDANTAHGAIKIWYSNNEQEVAWGKQAVAAWNAGHANEQVYGRGDPGRQVVGGSHHRRHHRRHRRRA